MDPSEKRPEACKELLAAKWLRKVVIRTVVKRLDLALLVPEDGQDEDRDRVEVAKEP